MTKLNLKYFKEKFPDYYKYVVKKYELISEKDLEDILKYAEELYKNSNNIAPKKEWVFKALEKTKFEKVKVVILGQDPYPDIDKATGLAFDSKVKKLTNSLKNIIKEVYKHDNVDKEVVDLELWAEQGVLLLNSYLTVNTKNKHKHKDWQKLTDAIIMAIDEYSKKNGKKVVFMFWGEDSCITGLRTLFQISNDYRRALTATHPSYRSKNKESRFAKSFNGCNHFEKANEFLEDPIDWKV